MLCSFIVVRKPCVLWGFGNNCQTECSSVCTSTDSSSESCFWFSSIPFDSNLVHSIPFYIPLLWPCKLLSSSPWFSSSCPRGFPFTWWGCLCLWYKSTELSHFFFYSVLVSVSVFMALSTVFHSINFPDNSPLSHSVLPVLLLPYWSFQLYDTAL